MLSRAKILVTGATGNTGSRVVAGIRAGGQHARAASRRPAADDRNAVPFDWADASTFDSALAGTRAVYLVAPTDVADPVPLVRPFLDRAVTAGVRRVVLLSSSAVARGEPGMGEIHDLVAGMFPEPTVLRPSWFMQNFVGDHPLAQSIRRSRQVVSATGDGRLGFIDAADIAAVAVRALLADEPLDAELVLTGPESLSYPQCAAIVSEVLGENVCHVDLTESALAEHLTAEGYPTGLATFLAALEDRIRGGAQDFVTDTVREVTGRDPTALRGFLVSHMSAA